MTIYATLGFAAAEQKRAGGFVAVGGEARQIVDVRREGADWPLYKLHGVSGLVSMDADGYVSWRFCGDARGVRDVA